MNVRRSDLGGALGTREVGGLAGEVLDRLHRAGDAIAITRQAHPELDDPS